MATINAVIMKCNNKFKNEENFFLSSKLKGISFNGIKVIDIFIDNSPILKEIGTDITGYFREHDLKEGINHYECKLCFATLKEATEASEAGFLFEICDGVFIQFIAVDTEESTKYRDLKLIQ